MNLFGAWGLINLAPAATLSGGAASPDFPLANLQDESRYTGAPARWEDVADLEATQFDAVLPAPKAIDLVALLFHSFKLTDQYRLTVAGADGDLNAPVYDSGWQPIYGETAGYIEDMEWEDDNLWTGQLLEEDLDLYPPHKYLWLPDVTISGAIRLEFDASENSDGYFDIGGLWIGRTFSPEMNFERGRGLGIAARDQVDESPSGRRIAEERRPRRRIAINYAMLQDEEIYRLFDAGMRSRSTRTVLFIPNPGDERSTLREAFPGYFSSLPDPRITYPGLGALTATLEEIIA